MKLKVDVDGVDRTIKSIERKLHRGMQESSDALVSNAKDYARGVISENEAIFNAEVYQGFRDTRTRDNSSQVRAKVYNKTEHAEVLERGAIYPGKAPPVEALLPWVKRHFNADLHDVNAFNSDDDGDDGGGGGSSPSPETKTLEFESFEREYPSEWNTYDPTVVETFPLDESFTGQDVEVFDVVDETFQRGVIQERHHSADQYEVLKADGETVTVRKPGSALADPYKVVGAESYESLTRDEKKLLHIDAVSRIDVDSGINSNHADNLKHAIKSSGFNMPKDKKTALDSLHKTKRFGEHNDPQKAAHGKSAGKYYHNYGSGVGQSTALHETVHGYHKEQGFSTEHYPSNNNLYYYNTFNKDGTNKNAGKSWEISEVLLSKNGDYPGLPDDGSIPQVIIDRVQPGNGGWDYKTPDSVSELLADDSEFGVGDRLKFSTPTSGGEQSHEVIDIEYLDWSDEIEYDGQYLTSYKFKEIGPDEHTLEMTVDENGGLVNMRGISIGDYAFRPNDPKIHIPDIELTRDDPYERTMEAVNLAFMEMMFTGSVMQDGGESRYDDLSTIGRAYSMRAANETLTTVSELLQSVSPDGKIKTREWLSRSNIEEIDENYPYLIRGWLESNNPSLPVKKILEDLGYDV